MGALTLKTFPFELRGWDIEKFESIDPTDGFGSSTRVYIKNNQIIQIEPDYNSYSFNSWLTDKGRQFFDGIFMNDQKKSVDISWLKIFKSLQQNIYLYDHCNLQSKIVYYFIIIFENVSLEVLSILNIISQNYSFIKVKRAQKMKLKNDLETSFQINLGIKTEALSISTLCLLINTNPRYEGFQLNLKLKQRILKGNFKCFSIGSVFNSTFPVFFLGSTYTIFKTIVEGNHLICQNLKSSRNPIIVLNNDIFHREDGQNILKVFTTLKNTNVFTKNWNGLNILNSSLHEIGIYSTAQFLPVTLNDLNNFSSLYFINTNIENCANLKRIIELKTLILLSNKNDQPNYNHLVLDQNYYKHINKSNSDLLTTNKWHIKYFFIPTSMFYENNETYINTQGFIKKTTKVVLNNNTRSNWQILRKLLKIFNTNFILLSNSHDMISFNSTKLTLFKSFISFQFFATQDLSHISHYLKIKNKPFNLYKNDFSFYKIQSSKIWNTKFKYWLDDFFVGGKDEYSQHSTILTNCSKVLRTESTNFF